MTTSIKLTKRNNKQFPITVLISILLEVFNLHVDEKKSCPCDLNIHNSNDTIVHKHFTGTAAKCTCTMFDINRFVYINLRKQ